MQNTPNSRAHQIFLSPFYSMERYVIMDTCIHSWYNLIMKGMNKYRAWHLCFLEVIFMFRSWEARTYPINMSIIFAFICGWCLFILVSKVYIIYNSSAIHRNYHPFSFHTQIIVMVYLWFIRVIMWWTISNWLMHKAERMIAVPPT